MEEFNQEEYRGEKKSKKLTMPQIILEQIKRIAELGSKEFRGGYEKETITSIDGQPQIIKEYVEDGRQSYCNAVHTLSVLMINHLVKGREDKELLNKHKEIFEELEVNHDDYLEELEVKDLSEEDKQAIKYKYLSIKRQLSEDLFGELMVIFRVVKNHGGEEDGEEEGLE